ncbi:hypothetical protein FIBSPDRAFT_905533 [Athelia psychrophila]|uniref:Uncharacterized protein n=1 Tax=Athelia psychrophila TaxID=1759441 RepID=A0A167TCG6_9AGAM|nr:hypothetical protein FIBSPDRAFT_905533 [Fibularhizoctonia sp. CBS 109695]
MVHWLITSDTITLAHTEKLLLVIKTALRTLDIFCVRILGRLSVASTEGSVVHRELKAEDLVISIDDPVGRGLMDLAVELLVAYGPPGFMAALSLPGDIEGRIGWICTNPPPPTCAVIIISLCDLLADASINVTEPSIQIVGSQQVHVYPTFSEGQNPDRSADFIWDYVLLIQGIKRPVSADVAFQWLLDELFASLGEQPNSNGIHWVTLALIAAQKDDGEIEKELNIHFVVTSPHPMELLQAICDVIKKTASGTPLKVWHAWPGVLRDSTETRSEVLAQLQMVTTAIAAGPLKKAMTTGGVKDSLSAPVINKLLHIGKTLRRATEERKAVPVLTVNHTLAEELSKYNAWIHTRTHPLNLLGVVKYFWAQTMWVLERNGHFATFPAHLNSLSRAGLKIPSIMADYMCRYLLMAIGLDATL